MNYTEATTVLINLKQRYEKQWTKMEKKAFEKALFLVEQKAKK